MLSVERYSDTGLSRERVRENGTMNGDVPRVDRLDPDSAEAVPEGRETPSDALSECMPRVAAKSLHMRR